MIKVYFENEGGKYAELVAMFDSEHTYDACTQVLYELCRKNNFSIVTESIIDEVTLDDINDTLKY